MSVEATVLLGPLQNLLGWFQKNQMHKDQQKDEALAAINKALFASMKYSEEQQQSGLTNRDREFELGELWAHAAAKVRHASDDLAMRLHDKSIFWSSSIKWSREEVLLKRIDFEAVQHEIKLLLSAG
ncbi:hypothetical protein [Nevskia ramosa]|uniref:hypothetical protein n=1 Tax=Nevskia ramosa TaxID=64002 RepID=UPI003D11480B